MASSPKILNGQHLTENFSIRALEDMSDDWYDEFAQQLIINNYFEVEPYHWEGTFMMAPSERSAIATPAERALFQAFERAGQIKTSITLEVEKFDSYCLSTEQIMNISREFKRSYLQRLPLVATISDYNRGFDAGSESRLLDIAQRMKVAEYPECAIARVTGLTERNIVSLLTKGRRLQKQSLKREVIYRKTKLKI